MEREANVTCQDPPPALRCRRSRISLRHHDTPRPVNLNAHVDVAQHIYASSQLFLSLPLHHEQGPRPHYLPSLPHVHGPLDFVRMPRQLLGDLEQVGVAQVELPGLRADELMQDGVAKQLARLPVEHGEGERALAGPGALGERRLDFLHPLLQLHALMTEPVHPRCKRFLASTQLLQKRDKLQPDSVPLVLGLMIGQILSPLLSHPSKVMHELLFGDVEQWAEQGRILFVPVPHPVKLADVRSPEELHQDSLDLIVRMVCRHEVDVHAGMALLPDLCSYLLHRLPPPLPGEVVHPTRSFPKPRCIRFLQHAQVEGHASFSRQALHKLRLLLRLRA
eukprot:764090-Hanusia_phi.AAC.2